MRVLVTGGAGFLGSHLCSALIDRGDEVVCVDDLSTGLYASVAGLTGSAAFHFHRHDVRQPLLLPGAFDCVAHLASPASPPIYRQLRTFTLTTGAEGTRQMLDFARRNRARFVFTSTSEVYGDPLVHPQPESYAGNVNPIGPRSVYDEAKRYAEALTMAYREAEGVNTGIVRIFNTYGPGMRPDDGRVVTTFIEQALRGQPLTVFGDGGQTRSLCYVDDLVRGLIAMLDADVPGPINLGNPEEMTVRQIADLVKAITRSPSALERRPLPADDPVRRCPDISLARLELGWAPKISVKAGLTRTVEWSRTNMSPDGQR